MKIFFIVITEFINKMPYLNKNRSNIFYDQSLLQLYLVYVSKNRILRIAKVMQRACMPGLKIASNK